MASVETGIQLAIPQHWLRQSARAQLAKERGHPPLPADGVLKCRELVDQALLPAAEGPFADLDQKEQALNRSPQPQRSSSAATRRKRSISSPTFTYPCMASTARSRSVLPERPVPAMNTTVGAVVLDCGAAGPTSRSERSATCSPQSELPPRLGRDPDCNGVGQPGEVDSTEGLRPVARRGALRRRSA